jgi:hypothetical protein
MAIGDKPVKVFSAGAVRASIWQDEAMGKNNQLFNVFSVKVEKRYRDAGGNWQSTASFNRGDLADLELVVFKAREFASLGSKES